MNNSWFVTESGLRMPRKKPRSLMVSVGYRVTRLLRLALGRRRLLRLYLDVIWLLRRLAFELSGEMYGEQFPYGALALSTDVLERWIPSGATVVDIGCGTGRWSRFVAQFAGRVTAIDFRPERVEAARSVRTTSGQHLEYLVGDATAMLAERRFDVALLIHVIEHIDDADSLLTMLTRRVAILIVEVPDFDTEPLNYVRRQLGCRFESDADHVQEYTREVLDARLRRCGWSVKEWHHKAGAVLAVAASMVTDQ